jgi:hypothetical protein
MKINDNGIERDMTDDELATHQEWAKIKTEETKAETKAASDKAAARQAVLDKLGLTANEAAALLG